MTYNLKRIKETLDSDLGKELKSFLFDKLLELKNIDTLEKDTIPHLIGQRLSYKKLAKILNQIATFEQVKIVKKPNKYYV